MILDFKEIDKRSQSFWEKEGVFRTDQKSTKKKYYVLDMFPYPSGDGLHVGHIKGYFATDAIAHFKRMNSFNVLHPMGWDAFGLPAENYAIKVGKHPQETVAKNIANFKDQMNDLGLSYDWSREINTTDPEYYRWTQWIFTKLFESGLAYETNSPINFCPSCKTGLANEEVDAGECQRCHTGVVKKQMRQWALKITDYAEKLYRDIETLNWPKPIKEMQKNWIGRSEGAEIDFKVKGTSENIKVFTTRADTLYGATYMVLSPEHDLVLKITNDIQKPEIEKYIQGIQSKSDIERSELEKEKTGVFTGAFAINPINNNEIPIWIADYVLKSYGTGAVMAVPAHDQRDYDFAKKYNLEIIEVIKEKDSEINDKAYEGEGTLINSEKFNGNKSKDASKEIVDQLKADKKGDFTINYKLRDWIFSRQRYWGEPIPIVHCKNCGLVAVPEKDLPVKLPDVEKYEPTGTGESPLANIESWIKTKCPKCGGEARRETNTMPQWAGSCWYYLRYIDPKNNTNFVGKDFEKNFMPVDLYVGGAEHAVLHLLYARFWHKFLFDEGLVSTSEPFNNLKNVGLILGPDRQKMSKSRGNVINPDTILNKFGADSLRLYEMFIGPFDQPAIWSTNGITGTKKFIEKVVESFSGPTNKQKEGMISEKLELLTKSVTQKIEKFQFNTIVSDFMKFANEVNLSDLNLIEKKQFLQILSPFAPHTCEYLWLKSGENKSIFTSSWPKAGRISFKLINYVIEINAKKRALLEVPSELKGEKVIEFIKSNNIIKKLIGDKKIKKTIFIEGRLINFLI